MSQFIQLRRVKGLPLPGTFLRSDNTWATPAGNSVSEINSISYNTDGSISSVTTPSSTDTYTYNPDGSVHTVSNGQQVKTFNWLDGNLISVTVE